MKPSQLRNMLTQTLEDFRMSRGERQALSRILDHLDPTEEMLALYRNLAFELAREAIATSGTQKTTDIVDWLEDVAKVLQSRSKASSRVTHAESYFSPNDDCPRHIQRMFSTAKESADVCVFTITDDRICEEMIDAHKRGVRIRVITDDDKSLDLGSDVDKLQRAGIPVRIDRTSHHMHHKFALFDANRLLTGSYNWTRSAARDNEENFIVTGDVRFIRRFSDLFENLWQKFA
ncbi:MAG: phospholipase D-like domain-containing protein [Planctomycetaceae bacterium]